ncbi:SusD/RagB family nutrient-binding outer membrane lipoprotein [Ascidiimonas aurantiaca]|uniref:SusD/RagB family nutrient-binding outer membrane lipoprotein n=1 Tax=Ascidiimonas aurantiaca TaxID=1685432 RepID=UPI0030EBA026
MMKLLRYSLFTALVCLLIVSCDDFFNDNIDPNKKGEEQVTEAELLTPGIFYTARAQYNAAFGMCQYSQQLASYFTPGTDTHEEVQLTGAWTAIYLEALPDLNTLVQRAQVNGSPSYEGIAKILIATNIALATDQWGAVPFSQATIGEEDFTPSFDAQENIYPVIVNLLDEAITLLNQNDTSGLVVEEDDLIFGGDLSKWIKTAYALKARYAIHLTEVDQNTAVTEALESIANSFDSNADDYQLVYNSRNFNPWNAGVALPNNTGNLSVLLSDQLVSLMDGTSIPFNSVTVDPRLERISSINTETEDSFTGAVNGTGGEDAEGNSATADLGEEDFYSSQAAPLIIMSYAELKFIEAEALFLQNGGTPTSTGTSAGAYNAYLEGIRANMDKLGVPVGEKEAYLADTSIAVGADNLTLALIMREKFIATFLNAESFVDLRRYDFDPNVFVGLELPENHEIILNGEWVRRAQYPASEQTRNGVEVELVMENLDVGVWWDRD